MYVKLTAPPGTTVADLDHWQENLAKEFAKLAVAVLLKEQDELNGSRSRQPM